MTWDCLHRLCTALVVTFLTATSAGLAAGPAGTDEQAARLIKALAPGYTPWFSPLLGAPDDGMEMLLFALQAALGLGVIGYYLMLKRRQDRTGKKGSAHVD